jgi:SUMO ligase MMS21 Smc5/6 complex component
VLKYPDSNRLTQSSIIIRDRIHLKSKLIYNDPGVDTETVRPRHDINQYYMDLHEVLSTSSEDATESQRASQLIELSARPTPNMRGGAHSEMRQKVREWLARHRQS